MRVIPRDLFNEASLLNCYGRIYILLEKEEEELDARFNVEKTNMFDILQDSSSGCLTIDNLKLMVRGKPCELERPLNTREKWSLHLVGYDNQPDFEDIQVFDENGEFSAEMRKFLFPVAHGN